MLHEILLALAGHPSPIFDQTLQDFPLLTPAEAALLQSLGNVASLYRALQTHLQRIASSHPSVVCRAVGSEILTSHLRQYEADLLKLETQSLCKDSVPVGAHNTVPLAYIVSSFSIWKKKLEWYWRLACIMLPENDADIEPTCTSAKILNVLSEELQTGYPFIEEAAIGVLKAAHRAWLRQLSSWLLITGSSDVDGYNLNSDLFLRATGSQGRVIELDSEQIPAFINAETASSLLFVGKCLNVLSQSFSQIPLSRPSSRQAGQVADGRSGLVARPADAVRSECLKPLKEISLPITSSSLSKAVAAMRASLSQQLLGRALPIDKLLQTFSYLHQYLLVGDCDFIDALIAEADRHMALRHEQTKVGKATDVGNAIAALMLREGELGSILAKTWTALAATVERDVDSDDSLEWARQHLFLRLQNPEQQLRSKDDKQSRTNRPQASSSFNDFLISVPAVIDMKTDSSFNLLFSADDSAQYQAINAYLLAIRRAHLHLCKLWREEPLRKDKPTFAARPSRTRAILRLPTNAQQKAKNKRRAQSLRPVWTSCSATAATLLELGDYLSSDVVAHSWNTFRLWATSSTEAFSRSVHSTTHRPTTSTDSTTHRPTASTDSGAASLSSSRATHAPPVLAERRDPEELIQAHRQYLDSLAHSLLLTDASFTAVLRELLRRIDQLIPLVRALHRAQQRVDLQDEGVLEDTKVDYALEERQAYDELMKMRRRLDADRAQLVARLRTMNDTKGYAPVYGTGKTGFEPYRSRNGLERLLLKVDFGAADE